MRILALRTRAEGPPLKDVQPGRYSVKTGRNGVHHFHRLWQEFMGVRILAFGF